MARGPVVARPIPSGGYGHDHRQHVLDRVPGGVRHRRDVVLGRRHSGQRLAAPGRRVRRRVDRRHRVLLRDVADVQHARRAWRERRGAHRGRLAPLASPGHLRKVGLTMDTLPLKRDLRLAYRTSLLVALLIVVVSAGGLAWGSTGLYGVDPNRALGVSASTAGVLVPGSLVQDIFNLAIGLPILSAALWLARRGAQIGLLLWPGALVYRAYTTIGLVASVDCDIVRQRLAGAVRPRIVGGLLVGLALLTVGQDAGGAVATALAGGAPIDPLARGVWIADLTLGVPAMLIVGGLLWRRASLGYAAAAGLLLSFGITSVVIAAMIALQPVLTGALIDGATVIGLLVFGAVSLAPLLLSLATPPPSQFALRPARSA